jgi:hypothetical protein
LLVVLLGAATLFFGVIAATLPPLSDALIPWIVTTFAALAYPLFLYPLFRDKRADYPFRALHFAPLVLLALRFSFDLVVPYMHAMTTLRSLYTWGWTLPGILVTFLLLILFSLSVLRQRVSRILALIVLLVPFIVLGQMSQRNNWNPIIATTLWGGVIDTGTGSIIVAQNGSSRRQGSQGSQGGSAQPASRIGQGSTSSRPPRLPTSGPITEGLALTLLAGYTTVLHRRAARRACRA